MHLPIRICMCLFDCIKSFDKKLMALPSRHMASKQCCINVDGRSLRCIDTDTKLF